MQHYYILSLKHSKHQSQYIWWKPNDNGYTIDIDRAGIYTAEQIEREKLYYSNTDTLPVPVEYIEKASKIVAVPTTDKNCGLFKISDHLLSAKDV